MGVNCDTCEYDGDQIVIGSKCTGCCPSDWNMYLHYKPAYGEDISSKEIIFQIDGKEVTPIVYQQKLFKEINHMKYEMQRLASFIQNDFDRMLEDKVTTKEKIKVAIVNMDKTFIDAMTKIRNQQEKCRILMKFYSE